MWLQVLHKSLCFRATLCNTPDVLLQVCSDVEKGTGHRPPTPDTRSPSSLSTETFGDAGTAQVLPSSGFGLWVTTLPSILNSYRYSWFHVPK